MKSTLALILSAALVGGLLFLAINLASSPEKPNLIPDDQSREILDKNVFRGQYFSFLFDKKTQNPTVFNSEGSEEIVFQEGGDKVVIQANELLPGDSLETLYPVGSGISNKTTVAQRTGFLFTTSRGQEFLFVQNGVLYTVLVDGKKLLKDMISRIKPKQ